MNPPPPRPVAAVQTPAADAKQASPGPSPRTAPLPLTDSRELPELPPPGYQSDALLVDQERRRVYRSEARSRAGTASDRATIAAPETDAKSRRRPRANKSISVAAGARGAQVAVGRHAAMRRDAARQPLKRALAARQPPSATTCRQAGREGHRSASGLSHRRRSRGHQGQGGRQFGVTCRHAIAVVTVENSHT